jgi:hypothetical protein
MECSLSGSVGRVHAEGSFASRCTGQCAAGAAHLSEASPGLPDRCYQPLYYRAVHSCRVPVKLPCTTQHVYWVGSSAARPKQDNAGGVCVRDSPHLSEPRTSSSSMLTWRRDSIQVGTDDDGEAKSPLASCSLILGPLSMPIGPAAIAHLHAQLAVDSASPGCCLVLPAHLSPTHPLPQVTAH